MLDGRVCRCKYSNDQVNIIIEVDKMCRIRHILIIDDVRLTYIA
jgi:hypothetical protein